MSWIGVVVVCAAIGGVSCTKHFYNDELLPQSNVEFSKMAVYALKDIPTGDQDARVDLEATFTARTSEVAAVFIQILLVHADDFEKIGHVFNGKRQYCCNPMHVDELHCTPGQAIIQGNPSVQSMIVDNVIPKVENGTARKTYFERTIGKSGMYYLFLLNCMKETGDVYIDGYLSWYNAYGLLPATLYGSFWFYGIVSLVYLVAGLLWFIMTAVYWRSILKLQHWMAAVLGLGMMETATWYFAYLTYNKTGVQPTTAILFAVLFSTLKHVLSRVIVLIVAMGYGVIKPTLGDATRKVIALAAAYFLLAGARDLFDNMRTDNGDVPTFIVFTIIAPVAALDAIFYWWIFVSIARSIKHLQQRQQTAKLKMYKLFAGVLGVSVVASVVLMVIQIAVRKSVPDDEAWKGEWVFDAYWHVHYLVILAGMMVIWRPNSENKRYAYMEQLNQEDPEDNDDVVPLASFATPTQRARAEEEPERKPTTPKEANGREGDKTSLLTSVAFNIADEDGEHAVREVSKML